MPASPPSTESNNVVSFSIWINNKLLPITLSVISISVNSDVKEAAKATITVSAGVFPLKVSVFNIGDDIRIELGYNSLNSPVFYGKIEKIALSINEKGSELIITCADDIPYAIPPDGSKQPALKFTYGESVIAADLTIDGKGTAIPGVIGLTGSVRFAGSYAAGLGDLVQLDGFGTAFDGNAYVSGLQQELANGNWFTTLKFGIPDTIPEPTNDIITASGLKISFDNENKILQLSTPAGNTIKLSDNDKTINITDQNFNQIVMSESGIMLKSARNLILDADGDLELNAVGKLILNTKQDATIAALNVSATAELALNLKANFTAELSAAGQTTVKGAMVMIN